MKIPKSAIIFLGIWLVLFALAFVAPRFVAATGDGFTRGLNRIGIFFLWHFAALVVAVAAAIWGWVKLREFRVLRWVCSVPLCIHVLMILLVVVGVIATRFGKPEPVNEPPRATTAPAAVAEPVLDIKPMASAEAVPDIQSFQGIYRSGFETSHFYTMEGQGPWWLEASESDWEKLQSFHVDGPGRSGGVTVALSVQGYLGEVDAGIKSLAGAEKKIQITAIDSIRALTTEEFELVLKTIRK